MKHPFSSLLVLLGYWEKLLFSWNLCTHREIWWIQLAFVYSNFCMKLIVELLIWIPWMMRQNTKRQKPLKFIYYIQSSLFTIFTLIFHNLFDTSYFYAILSLALSAASVLNNEWIWIISIKCNLFMSLKYTNCNKDEQRKMNRASFGMSNAVLANILSPI